MTVASTSITTKTTTATNMSASNTSSSKENGGNVTSASENDITNSCCNKTINTYNNNNNNNNNSNITNNSDIKQNLSPNNDSEITYEKNISDNHNNSNNCNNESNLISNLKNNNQESLIKNSNDTNTSQITMSENDYNSKNEIQSNSAVNNNDENNLSKNSNSDNESVENNKCNESNNINKLSEMCNSGSSSSYNNNGNNNTNNNNNNKNNSSNNNKNECDIASTSSNRCAKNNKPNNKNSSQKNNKITTNRKSATLSVKKVEESDSDDNEALDKPRKILLQYVNPHIICNLCQGYLIDATTIVECLHSFCHSCIMKHLRTEKYCPRCEMMINTVKPNIKSDTTLQAIVYKLVPGLYEKELMRKRAFYKDRPEDAKLATPEQRGDDTEYLIFGPTENMSLSLEYADVNELPDGDRSDITRPKYLQCPAVFTIAHLKKFILLKFGINPNLFLVQIMYKVKTILLPDHYTLMDVAYIYTWKREAPMKFYFRIKEVDNFTAKLNACRRQMKAKETSIHIINDKNDDIDRSINDNNICKSNTDDCKLDGSENNVVKITPNENINNTTNNKQNDEKLIENKNEPQDAKEEMKSSHLNTQQNIPNDNVLRNNDSNIKLEKNKLNEKISVDDKSENYNPSSSSSSSVELLKSDQNEKSNEKRNNENEQKLETLKITFDIKDKEQPKITSPTLICSPKCTENSTTKSPQKLSNNKNSKQQSPSGTATTLNNHEKLPEKHQDERKVENIKLKIDLSKQSSVTIFNNNMSSSSKSESIKKDNLKSVKQEKELKSKSKKEKEKEKNDKDNTKSSPKNNEDKHNKMGANLCENQNNLLSNNNNKKTVPPITIKTDRNSSNLMRLLKDDTSSTQKCNINSNNNNNSPSKDNNEDEDEEKKSEFLNSFALAPIKNATATNSQDKINDNKKTNNTYQTATTVKNPPSKLQSLLINNFTTPKSSSYNKSINVASKRKSKEPIKTPMKKPKLEPLKYYDKPASSSSSYSSKNNELTETISFKLAPFPINTPPPTKELTTVKNNEDEKLMPAPPTPTQFKMLNLLKTNNTKQLKDSSKSTSPSSSSNKIKSPFQSSISSSTPQRSILRPMIPAGIATSRLSIAPTPPGNRTPIAKRYQPILPKQSRPNPFANLTSDILQNKCTEIKQISPNENNQDVKVYGPNMSPPASLKQNPNQKSPTKSTSPPSSVSASSSPSSSPLSSSSSSHSRATLKNQNSNYLNYALLNASKAKNDPMPLGYRTPIYTPNSPIYSPNSPQYIPNYNIPVKPTYKYTTKNSPSTAGAKNHLQNILGQNKQLSNLFPAPPIKKSPEPILESSIPSQIIQTLESPPTNISKSPTKRSSPPETAKSAQEPPEKQAKVQSLLNSCNINIPSSLSITITNDDNDSNTMNISNAKRKSPVHNYIEILQLPDNQPVTTSTSSSSSSANVTITTTTFSNEKTIKSPKTTIKNETFTTDKETFMIGGNYYLTSSVTSTTNSSNKFTVATSNKLSPQSNSKTNQHPSLLKGNITNVNNLKTSSNSIKDKKTSPEKKSKKSTHNTQNDKKKHSLDSNNKSNKTNEISTSTLAAIKKFRHILPRITTQPPSNATTTLSTSSSSKSSPTLSVSSSSTITTSATTSGFKLSPDLTHNNKRSLSINNALKRSPQNDDKKQSLEVLDLTGSPTKTSISSSSSSSGPIAVVTSSPNPLSQSTLIPTATSDLTAFLNETMLRAQQQTVNSNGIFLPHLAAAASFNPSFASINFGYNIQQAYLIEQFSRMQKAGHDALEKYMQKLKAGASINFNNKNGSTSPNRISSTAVDTSNIAASTSTKNSEK